jgi:hypothetical protein
MLRLKNGNWKTIGQPLCFERLAADHFAQVLAFQILHRDEWPAVMFPIS